MKHLALILIIFCFSTQALAEVGLGFRIAPGFMYIIEDQISSGTEAKRSRLLSDIRVGYEMAGPYVGAIYSFDETTLITTATTTERVASYGPSVGYMFSDFFLLASYYLSSTADTNSGGNLTTLSTGTGYRAEFGFRFGSGMVGGSAEMVYSSLNYKKRSFNGSESSIDETRSTLYPRLSVWFNF